MEWMPLSFSQREMFLQLTTKHDFGRFLLRKRASPWAPPPGAPISTPTDRRTGRGAAPLRSALPAHHPPGDYNRLHLDPAAARAALGLGRPLLHGLCTLGVATRALVARCCPQNPSRLSKLKASFSAPVYPGETLLVNIWETAAEPNHRQNSASRESSSVRVEATTYIFEVTSSSVPHINSVTSPTCHETAIVSKNNNIDDNNGNIQQLQANLSRIELSNKKVDLKGGAIKRRGGTYVEEEDDCIVYGSVFECLMSQPVVVLKGFAEVVVDKTLYQNSSEDTTNGGRNRRTSTGIRNAVVHQSNL